MKIRALTYNVHKFFNWNNTVYFLENLKEQLHKLDLDVVFLQEIRGVQPIKYGTKYINDPLEHLADEVWDHFVYGKNAAYSSGHHGNAILSKRPILKWENIDISNHRLECRSLLMATIVISNRPIQLACTHLDLTSWGRQRQTARILSNLASLETKTPLIFGGDFNDWRGRNRQELVQAGLKDVFPRTKGLIPPTYPSIWPQLCLDALFYKNLLCTDRRVLKDSHWKKMSDHLPIIAEFEYLGNTEK